MGCKLQRFDAFQGKVHSHVNAGLKKRPGGGLEVHDDGHELVAISGYVMSERGFEGERAGSATSPSILAGWKLTAGTFCRHRE